MGYSTTFYGSIQIAPPLSKAEEKYLHDFGTSRRTNRTQGPYYANPGNDMGQDDNDPSVINHNEPPPGQPGLWCQWAPTSDRHGLEWDGGEKFYDSEKWLVYLIEHFLKPNSFARLREPEQFSAFKGHSLNGTILAQGEEEGDIWKLVVKDNQVSRCAGKYKYPFNPKKMSEDEYFNAMSDHEINWDKVKWDPPVALFYELSPEEKAALALSEQKRLKTGLDKKSGKKAQPSGKPASSKTMRL